MKSFSVTTLGCKVNQYEGDQIATLLRRRGLIQVQQGGDIRVVHTCSVTMPAAAKSRQAVRRAGRYSLNVLPAAQTPAADGGSNACRVIVTGCWATSNTAEARQLPGVDAVLPNTSAVANQLHQLLDQWAIATDQTHITSEKLNQRQAETKTQESSIGGVIGVDDAAISKSLAKPPVNENSAEIREVLPVRGAVSLPLLESRRQGHQRAFLKIQDGCDAHCTYCIIPRLRPTLYSKPIDDAVEEARRLIDSGHREIVLTGIFIGAFGQSTALRRRQSQSTAKPLGDLVHALCTRVRGLRRLRLSSLEPGDLDERLLAILRDHEQVAPHFHLPLQSGSDLLLRRMNRQYTRDDFLRMIDSVRNAFDRPALTTDIIVGFPGETDAEFQQTLQIVDHAQFIDIHAFSYSPRPGTAAARWTRDFVRGPVVNQRIAILTDRAARHSLDYRRTFVGQAVEVIVENSPGLSRGRCERYFEVLFTSQNGKPGDVVRAQIDRVTMEDTFCDAITPSRIPAST